MSGPKVSNIVDLLESSGAVGGGVGGRLNESLAATVSAITGLRPFPRVAQEVMANLSSAEFDLHQVERIIESDAALASSVLRVANSASQRGRNLVRSIRAAMVRLGASMVRNVVAAAAAHALFRDLGGVGALFRDHCTGTGTLARVLAVQAKYPSPGEAYLTGLMHDVGKLLIIQVNELDYQGFGVDIFRPDNLAQVEISKQGYCHGVLGAQVLEFWNFAVPIPAAVALHHYFEVAKTTQAAKLVALVRLASRLDYDLRQGVPEGKAYFKALAKSEEGEYLDLDAKKLSKGWGLIREAWELAHE